MEVCKLNIDLLGGKSKENKSQISLDGEKILCNHCKRTASNGIRCLGICVADSDY